MSETAHLEEHAEDPLAGDVDRFVHPDETRTDEQIAYDKKHAVEPYGYDAAEDHWAEYDELHDDRPEPKAEDKYDFTEKDLESRKRATTWLEDVAASYEKRAEKFGRVKGDPDKKGVSAYEQPSRSISESDAEESKALNRLLENGFYATSDDNVYSALRTIETGVLWRAGHFSTWPDGSYKAAADIQTTDLNLEGLREFTGKFAGLQERREETIAKNGYDPLSDQMEDVFGLAGAE